MLEEISVGVGLTKEEQNVIEKLIQEHKEEELSRYVEKILNLSTDSDKQYIKNWLITATASSH
jgi:hypothetical protein